MKKFSKKLMGTVLILSLMTGLSGVSVQAAGDTLNGYPVSGSVSTNANSATAVTSYSRPGTIEAKATVYGIYGIVRFKDTSDTNTASIGGASATAYISTPGSSVIGGKGEHTVTATTGSRWSYTSRTGDTFD